MKTIESQLLKFVKLLMTNPVSAGLQLSLKIKVVSLCSKVVLVKTIESQLLKFVKLLMTNPVSAGLQLSLKIKVVSL